MSDAGTMRDYAEKRDFIRMQVNATIELTLLATGRTVSAVCKNLSGMGMQVILDQPIELGAEVQTALPSNSPDFPTFKTTARVIRSEPAEDGFLAGLEILRIEQ